MSQDSEFALNELLIALVRERRAIWDLRSKSYSDKNAKSNLWLDISRIVGKDEAFLKTRWKTLRDRYMKCVREEKGKSGQAAVSRIEWPLKAQMEFLRDVSTARKVTESFVTESEPVSQTSLQASQSHLVITVPQLQEALSQCQEECEDHAMDTLPLGVNTLSRASLSPPTSSALTFKTPASTSSIRPPTPSPPLTLPLLSPPLPSRSPSPASASTTSSGVSSNKRKKSDESSIDTAFLEYVSSKNARAEAKANREVGRASSQRQEQYSSLELFFLSVAKEAEQLTLVRRMKLRRFVDEKLLELVDEQENSQSSCS